MLDRKRADAVTFEYGRGRNDGEEYFASLTCDDCGYFDAPEFRTLEALAGECREQFPDWDLDNLKGCYRETAHTRLWEP